MSADTVMFDPEALRQKYLEERDKRLQKRPHENYRTVIDYNPALLADTFNAPLPARDPLFEDIDVIVIGGGMSGIITGAELKKSGVKSLRIVESAADLGGTWYWNRYPGAACDTESYIYMPMLDETSYVPTEKYARAPEIFGHLKRIADHFGLSDGALLGTKVETVIWQEADRRWVIKTDRGDVLNARFVCVAAGVLAQPKLPAIPGLEEFRGKMFLTARWDYAYTGGTPENPELVNLRDKRVAIVGTGCTAVQAVPVLGRFAADLFVVQRTPSMINERNNRPTDPAWAESLEPGWQRHRMQNFENCVADPKSVVVDLVDDGWTMLARKLSDLDRVRGLATEDQRDTATLGQLADFATMEEYRRRVEALVEDPARAETLKAYYNVHCKRPTYHDEYLPTFNNPNVTLVDTEGKGIERLTAKGFVVAGREYAVDCIIFSTGWEYLSLHHRTGRFTVRGVDGVTLDEKWADGFRSVHGIFASGFPNLMFIGQLRDAAGSFNANSAFTPQAEHVGKLVARWIERGVTRAEVSAEAETGWREAMEKSAVPTGTFYADCTPDNLNNLGDTSKPLLRTVLFGGGVLKYEQLLREWRDGGVSRDMSIS